MLSQTVEYTLRAVVHLAITAPKCQTTDEIATATLVPRAYLSKVLQNLARAEIVQSRRGIGGGMTLAVAPESLTILQVIDAVEPIQRIKTCPLGLEAHGEHLCPLHRRMDDALKMVEDAFRNSTLAEILAQPTQSFPLCPFPSLTEQNCPALIPAKE